MLVHAIYTVLYILRQESKRFLKTEDDSIPLPDPFPLPKHYQRNVEEALKSGKLTTKERRMFLSNIASSILRFKRYPSRDDYVSVSCAVVHTYPFLKATSGRPYVSLQSLPPSLPLSHYRLILSMLCILFIRMQ